MEPSGVIAGSSGTTWSHTWHKWNQLEPYLAEVEPAGAISGISGTKWSHCLRKWNQLEPYLALVEQP